MGDALCRAAANAFSSLRMPERPQSPTKDSSTMADRRWSYDAGLPLETPIVAGSERRKNNSTTSSRSQQQPRMPERKHSPKITTLRKKQPITIGTETTAARQSLRRRSSYSGCPTMTTRIGDDEEYDKHNASSSSSSRNDATKNAKLTTSATVPTNNTSMSPTNLHRCLPTMPLHITSPKLLL